MTAPLRPMAIAAAKPRVGLFVTEDGMHVLAMVREQRTSWLANRLEQLAPEERAAIHAALAPLDDVSMRDR